MKTCKYYISFDSIETKMCNDIEISKKEFTRQLQYLQKQMIETADDEYPMEELEPTSYTHDTYTATNYKFYVGTATTYLTKIECKEGYYFKK